MVTALTMAMMIVGSSLCDGLVNNYHIISDAHGRCECVLIFSLYAHINKWIYIYICIYIYVYIYVCVCVECPALLSFSLSLHMFCCSQVSPAAGTCVWEVTRSTQI